MNHLVTPSFTQDGSYTTTHWDFFPGNGTNNLHITSEANQNIWLQLHSWHIIKVLACLLSAPVGFPSALNLYHRSFHPPGLSQKPATERKVWLDALRGCEIYIDRQFLRKCVNLCVNIWITFGLLDMGGRFPTLSCSISLAGSAVESPILRSQKPASCLASFSRFRAPPFPRTRFPPLPGDRGRLPR